MAEESIDEWTMLIILPTGEQLSFTGKRSIPKILLGAKQYIEQIKDESKSNQTTRRRH
jgi:hypothetical protein